MLMFLGSSYIRHLDGIPSFFKYGVTANTIEPSPLDLSATTRGVLFGSSPRKTH